MPLYEYQCDACAHRFELIRKYSDPPVETCPVCGGAVQKLFSSPAIQFKGSGFYITDYARAGKGEAASTTGARDGASSGASKGENSGDSKADTKAESTSESKSESKPDAKSEAKPTGGSKPSSSTSA